MTWTLIAINVGVFFYELSLRPFVLDRFILTWGAVPTNVLNALADPWNAPVSVWATLVTSQFLHGGWFHILGNMLYLLIFGDNVEDVLGHFSYLIFYLLCGVIAMLAESVIKGASRLPAIGASGAIAGVLGAYLVLYPWARIRILVPLVIVLWTFQVPAIIVLGWWFIQQFFYGTAALSHAAASGIAFWAHIGGFVAGMILVLPFIGRVYGKPRASNYRGFDDYM